MIYEQTVTMRPATAEEKDKLRELMGPTIEKLRAKGKDARADEIEARIEDFQVAERKTVARKLTGPEKAQRAKDQATAEAEERAAADLRQQRIENMRTAADNMELSYEDFLITFPSDITIEEMNG